jgi:glycosyltransferase involved in cell wall biosynthesis
MPSVDVAVPNYQYGRYLWDCVTSVLTQEVPNLRVLIIDNASTDNSLEVAQELAASDRRVQVVAHHTNLGHHASFNEGVDWASSDYFVMLSADDLLAPSSLSRAISFMEKHANVHLAYGRALWICNDERMPQVEPLPQATKWRILPGGQLLETVCRAGGRHNIEGPTVVVRTSVQKRVGHYRRALTHTDDLEMWMRFARLGDVAETDSIQGFIRIHPMMRTVDLSQLPYAGLEWDLRLEAAFESFFANEGASAPEATRLRRIARRRLAERAYWGALSNLAQCNMARSVDQWKFAATRWPATVVIPPVAYLFRRKQALRHMALMLLQAARRTIIPARGGGR